MLLLTAAPVFILLLFGSQEINGFNKQCKREICPANEREEWSYSGSNGPSNWGANYPDCDGLSQSPINFTPSDVVVNDNLILKINNYEQCVAEATINNNGHTVQVTPTDGISRSIEIDTKSGPFFLEQLHFHWGDSYKCGSEHLINGKAAPMEMHLVHRNSERRIAVLGILIHTHSWNNSAASFLVQQLSSVRNKDETTNLASRLCLSKLLPRHGMFYRYEGSLTTPPCSEGVVWTVFKDCIFLGTGQVKEFRNLFSTNRNEEEQCYLRNNWRPVQKINTRTVSYYSRKNGIHSSRDW